MIAAVMALPMKAPTFSLSKDRVLTAIPKPKTVRITTIGSSIMSRMMSSSLVSVWDEARARARASTSMARKTSQVESSVKT